MFNNQNYPWYLQQSPIFKHIYDGLFDIVSMASPLDIWKIFDVEQLAGKGLLYLGRMWGLRGIWGGQTTGMIYDIDKWSTDKYWTGEMRDLDAKIYRNFIKMKIYINGRQYSLNTIKNAFAILLDGFEHQITIDEGYMNFVINVSANSQALNILYNMSHYDTHFLGKPSGISYTFNFVPTDGGTVPTNEDGETK